MNYFKIITLFFVSCITVYSQKETTHEDQLWTGFFNQTRLNNKWGFWVDLHYRGTEHFVNEPSKIIFRPGVTYYVNDHLKLTNGYTFVNHFPEQGHKNISQPEHRIWQQMQNHNSIGKARFMQWIRFEERFRRNIKNDNELANGYRFDLRLRSNLLFNIPFSKKGIAPKTFSAVLNDEIFINYRNPRNATYYPFDQNRFFAGLSYNFTSHSNLQFGYMNVFQQLNQGTKFKNINAIRVFYFQNLDLRKGK